MSERRITWPLLALLMLMGVSPVNAIGRDYVNDLSQPPPIALQIQVQQELESRVAEMVSLGHMAPTLYFIGLGGDPTLGPPVIFYVTPSETIYTLSAAYPYLSNSSKIQVKAFLDAEIQDYPPHQQGSYTPVAGQVSDLVGARREYFIPNPTQAFNFWPGVPVHISVLYSLWLYSNNTGDWSYVTDHYDALKSIYTNFRNENNITSYPELSGAIGFARIAQHLEQTTDYEDAVSFMEDGFTRGADFDQFLDTAHANYPHGSHGYTTPIFMFNRNPVALHFNRDIGIFLRDHAQLSVVAYAEQINENVPLWWLTGVALSHGENAYAAPEISWTNFMLHAYVLDTPVEQLERYLDAPDRKGDLLYIQKLVAVIETLGPPDLSTSAKTVSPFPYQSGQRITYTVAIRNTGKPLTHIVYLTDTVPTGLTYVTDSLTSSLLTVDDSAAPALYWSGVLSDTLVATITYAVTITLPPSLTQAIKNTVTISTDPIGTLTRTTTIVVDGQAIYLPILLKREM